jgi:hypothetical protein
MQLRTIKPDPNSFQPTNACEGEAQRTWQRLEPNNKQAFYTTYFKAYENGLPIHKFGEFASEIEQDPSIKNRGAIFNLKVRNYFARKRNNMGLISTGK